MSPSPVKVTKRGKTTQLDASVPFRGDVFLFFIVSLSFSGVMFFLFSSFILDDIFASNYLKFFSLIGIYALTNIIGEYPSYIIVNKVVANSYNPTYFEEWYSRRNRNVIRIILDWVINSAFYVYGFIPLMTIYFFGIMTLSTKITAYFIIRIIAGIISSAIASYLAKLKSDYSVKNK